MPSIQVRKNVMVIQQTQKNIFCAHKIEMGMKFKAFPVRNDNTKTLNSNTRILQEFYRHRQSFPVKVSYQNIRNEPFLENALISCCHDYCNAL